ncbi:MAG: hypothetical protein HY875_11230 [Chloroflexi bacterium]|nr:hypothetical protein [Chloroflexota bacterium]
MVGPVGHRRDFGQESLESAVKEHREDPWGRKPGNSCLAFFGLVILVLTAAVTLWRLFT